MSSKPKNKPQKQKKKNNTNGKERANKVVQPAAGVLMQVSKYFAAANVNQQAALIAAAIMCPGAFPPIRFQDGYDCMETSLVSPFMVQEVPFTATIAGQPDDLGYPNEEQWAFAFRDPRRCLVYLDHNSTETEWNYYMAGRFGTIDWTKPASPQFLNDLGIQYMFRSGAYAPHGEVCYPGTVDSAPGLSFFPITVNDKIKIDGVDPSGAFRLLFTLFDGGDNLLDGYIDAAATPAGLVTFQMNAASAGSAFLLDNWSGYIGLRDIVSTFTSPYTSAAITGGSVIMTGNSSVWCQRSLSDYEDIEELIESFRANGMSLMFTNTANELARNGDVAGWQVPKSMPWAYLARQGFNTLAQKPRRGLGEAKNGLHGFWKPTNSTDLNFRAVGSETATTLTESAFALEPESDYLAICVRIPNAEGRAGRFVLAVNGEARFESSWFGYIQDMPYSRAACQQAMELLVTADQWHENPSHLKDIVNYLRENRGNLQELFKTVGTNFPMLAPFANVLSSATNLLK